jgi:hypothetical protein
MHYYPIKLTLRKLQINKHIPVRTAIEVRVFVDALIAQWLRIPIFAKAKLEVEDWTFLGGVDYTDGVELQIGYTANPYNPNLWALDVSEVLSAALTAKELDFGLKIVYAGDLVRGQFVGASGRPEV